MICKKKILLKFFIEDITELKKKKKITQSFSYDLNVTENSNKDVDTKSSKGTNVQQTNQTTQKEQLKLKVI